MATTRKSTQGARRGAAKKTAEPKKTTQSRKTAEPKKTTQARKTAQPEKAAQARKTAQSRKAAQPRKTAQPRKATQSEETERSTEAVQPQEKASQNGRPTLRTVAISAAAELAQLIGQTPESIVGVDKVDGDLWRVLVEVVESRRIPETTDILAVYEVDVDRDGVTGYRRINRYVRGRTEE